MFAVTVVLSLITCGAKLWIIGLFSKLIGISVVVHEHKVGFCRCFDPLVNKLFHVEHSPTGHWCST